MSVRKIQLISGIIGIILSLITLFIPFYETVLMNDHLDFPGLLYTYKFEFKIGVIGGLGSMYAWIHVPFCIALSILLILNKPNIPLSITLGFLLIPFNFLVFIGCYAGFGKPFGDNMLIGYWLLLFVEVVLVLISIYTSVKNRRNRQKSTLDF
ncbi:MAG: hypothetical protein ACO1N0_06455 [Fluviicola sp.]